MVKAIWAVACSVLMVLCLGASMLPDAAFAQDPAGKPIPPGSGLTTTGISNSNGIIGRTPILPAADNSNRLRKEIEAAKAPPSDTGYRLGPEDQLRISVWDNKDLTVDLVVRPDGKISMPLIQDVVAEGLTASQLAANIQESLSAFIVNPAVSVIVLQVNAPKYYVIGYVNRPGTYPLRGDTSVLQALALAGGMTQFASPRSIKLIRATHGKQDVRKINYYDIIDSGEGNYLLKSGDTIVVP